MYKDAGGLDVTKQTIAKSEMKWETVEQCETWAENAKKEGYENVDTSHLSAIQKEVMKYLTGGEKVEPIPIKDACELAILAGKLVVPIIIGVVCLILCCICCCCYCYRRAQAKQAETFQTGDRFQKVSEGGQKEEA